jgi:two-component system cell cycle sensor histidine kinase/response regulator CckA
MTEPNVDGETILVVDDDPSVLALIRRVLDRDGYEVLEASNGEVALDVASAHAGPIHLIVSDVNMPEMGGRLLLERVRGWYPALRFLLISGADVRTSVEAECPAEITAFLPKPFTHDELSSAVRALLDRPRRPAHPDSQIAPAA